MIAFQQNRIQQHYIPDLRASFEAYDADRACNNTQTSSCTSDSDSILSSLRDLLFNGGLNGLSILEKHSRLSIACFDLRQTKTIRESLFKPPSVTSESRSLWMNICSLARLRIAFQTFRDIALTLPSFEQVSICLLPRQTTSTKSPQHRLSLDETFAILELDLDAATTKAVVGRKWTVENAKREFGKLQKQRLHVHAEVQMLLFLNNKDSPASRPFPYFGCSKLSCFMCNNFLQTYGQFNMRGCHGRLFQPWTVPSVNNLLPGRADRIAQALVAVQKEVWKQLKAFANVCLQLERTSVVGKNSVSTVFQGQQSERQVQVERFRLKAERDRVVEMFQR
jgi:hypothetical protein